ncbi:hypothetical protein Mucpa_5114 [Mucilaginibacter paludis DSM 18603]|uniref:Uncharacterized protein n=1 Tax=Mucilaginibacter paludis DSM 18603 TaxID=714943 RepID=H1Y0W4_9SPHI|nr:hypothetical protein Mucpa_5114 [Mucilaginibacter paludis DSM 18603]
MPLHIALLMFTVFFLRAYSKPTQPAYILNYLLNNKAIL